MYGSRPESQSDKVTRLLRRLKEKQEEITQILDSLIEESAKGTPILVEGKKDAESLRALGAEGPIVTVKTGGKSYVDIVPEVEKLKTAKVVLLLDFDRRGKQGTNRIRQLMEHEGIEVDLEFWRALLGSAGKDVQCVEGLGTYLENLKRKTELVP